jgi:HEAT repeat protein
MADLIATLGDADPDVRTLAALSLGAIGPPAAEALPALKAAAGDSNENVKKVAEMAIRSIEGGAGR